MILLNSNTLEQIKRTKYNFKFHIVFTVVTLLINLFFSSNSLIGNLYVAFEVFLMLYFLILKKCFFDYFCIFFISLSSCIEFSAFASNSEDFILYNFKNIRILGINIAAIFSIISFAFIVFLCLKKPKLVREFRKKYKTAFFFCACILFFFISSVINMFINIVVNDNNVLNMISYIDVIFGELYFSGWTLITVLTVAAILILYQNRIEEIKSCVIIVLVSNIIVPLFVALCGYTGSYGNLDMLLSTLNAIYSPLLICLMFYSVAKKNLLLSLCVLFTLFLTVVFFNHASGKLILIFIIAYLASIVLCVKNKKTTPLIILFCMAVIVVLLIPILQSNNKMFAAKFDEVIKLLDVFDKNWYNNLGGSVKFRVSEMINITIEYSEKPYRALFGKGYAGTIKDYINAFYPTGVWADGGFSYNEFLLGSYYGMHETFLEIYIKNGFVGIVLFLTILVKMIKPITNNIFALVGFVWFIFFFDYSLTASITGIVCLLIGFICYDKEKNSKNKFLKKEKVNENTNYSSSVL